MSIEAQRTAYGDGMQTVSARTPARRGRWTQEERRAQVAALTLEIIAREGVRAATLTRIAEAAGIATPSLYNHFSGRTQILEAASDLLLERVLAWLDSSSNPNMLERLRELGGAVHESRIAPSNDWVIRPLFELAVAARSEGLTDRMRSNQMAVLQRFIDIVEEGKKQGTIREDADPRVVGWSVMGLGWTKDFALLEGLDQFISDGTADRILENVLERIAVGS